jgi:hypothetical protein
MTSNDPDPGGRFGRWRGAFDAEYSASTPLTISLAAAVLFGIPRVASAGYSMTAQALYVAALGSALVLLATNVLELRARV